MSMEHIMKGIFAEVEVTRKREQDESGQILLGELIARLAPLPGHLIVKVSTPDGLLSNTDGLSSYRGYYSDLAIERGGSEVTIAEMVDRLQNAVGETYEGYKGGDYTMSRSTPVWVASYGEASGWLVIDVVLEENVIVIVTTQVG